MNATRDGSIDNSRTHSPKTTRRLMVRGIAGGALGAMLTGSTKASVSGQEATPQREQPAGPQFEWIGTLTAQLSAPIVVGETPHGTRLIAPVASGTLEGPNLLGTLSPLGGDWLLVRPDGVGELDVRVIVETQDDALLYITYRGYLTNVLELLPRWAQGEEISPEEYYFVSTPWFETSAAQYDWLQRSVVVGIGTLILGGVQYELFAIN